MITGALVGFARWKFAPWLLLGAVLALGFSHTLMYAKGKTSGVEQERALQATAITKAVGAAKRAHETELKQRGWQDTREAEDARALNTALHSELAELAALPPKTLIQTRVVTHETGCTYPEPSLSRDFWLRYNAAGRQHLEADSPAADAVRTRL